METIQLAKQLYDAYCEGVGGIAFNGDKLPTSEQFFADESKQKQVGGWIKAAEKAQTSSTVKEDFNGKWVLPKSWTDFRAKGLLFFINTILHAFGWAIVVEVDADSGEVTACYPARVRFRGFDEKSQSEEHEKIAQYLAETAPNFPEEIK